MLTVFGRGHHAAGAALRSRNVAAVNVRSVPVAVAAGILLLAGCAKASDSVGASSRVLTGGSAPAVSAPPRQTSTSTATSMVTTSPTIAPTIAAPPTSGGTGEAQMTTSTGADVAPEETLPTVVPTSAPDIVTTAPEQTTPPSTTPPATTTPPPTVPGGAPAVSVVEVTCARQSSGAEWLVFRLGSTTVNAFAVVMGDGVVEVAFSPAVDTTSGTMINAGCALVTSATRVGNADGTVTWSILARGNLGRIDPPGPAAGGPSFVVKFTA